MWSVIAAGCHKPGHEPVASNAVEEASEGSEIRMQQVSIPLMRRDQAGAVQEEGSALIQRISVGAGKNKQGLMKVIAPAIHADATSVEIAGDDLSILAELSAALRSLVPLKEIQFRSFSVVRQGGETLLECSRASVDEEEEWNFHHVRMHGGDMQPVYKLKLAPSNSKHKATSRRAFKNNVEEESAAPSGEASGQQR